MTNLKTFNASFLKNVKLRLNTMLYGAIQLSILTCHRLCPAGVLEQPRPPPFLTPKPNELSIDIKSKQLLKYYLLHLHAISCAEMMFKNLQGNHAFFLFSFFPLFFIKIKILKTIPSKCPRSKWPRFLQQGHNGPSSLIASPTTNPLLPKKA